MADHIETLKALEKKKEYFIGIDSDGCAFDTMEIKHKECFIPNIICHWDMQSISRFAREAAEFVNLYSQWRGVNRFPALVKVFDLCAERAECIERGYKAPSIDSLRAWIDEETRLGNPALQAKVAETNDPVLARALTWSQDVNQTVGKIVHGVPPFPHVRESIQKLHDLADIMVVSATPNEALEREWEEHDIACYVRLICGQEMGSKKEHLQYGADGKYEPTKVLMVGDAPGDMKAAQANNFLFYPIIPGQEAGSWKRFAQEASEKFLQGQYAGDYESQLIKEFLSHLPSVPAWKN